MSRINTNVSSLVAVNVHNRNNVSLQTSLQRLSTGYRINSGKDDPSGLIASEALKSELKSTETAVSNAQRADNVIGTAEGALSEISSLLVNLQSLVGSAANDAGLSQEEKDANQLQVDSILNTVNRISNSASFEGTKLLNGSFDYTTSGINDTNAFTSITINSAKVSSHTETTTTTTQGGQPAVLYYRQTGTTFSNNMHFVVQSDSTAPGPSDHKIASTGDNIAAAVAAWNSNTNGYSLQYSYDGGTNTSTVAVRSVNTGPTSSIYVMNNFGSGFDTVDSSNNPSISVNGVDDGTPPVTTTTTATVGGLAVKVNVLEAAKTAQVSFLGSSTGLQGAATISIAGNKGTMQLSFASSTKTSAMVASVNQFADSTGVKAVQSGNAMKIQSIGYGASQFVSVSSNNAKAFTTVDADGIAATSDYGGNATVTVNGTTATSDGLNVKAVVGDLLDMNFTLNSSMNYAGAVKQFGVTGGGANFSLGAQVNTSSKASIGISAVNTTSIGKYVNPNGASGKVYTLNDLSSGKDAAISTGDRMLAQNIVGQAIKDVANMRGRLGAFQKNVIGATVNSLNVAIENLNASESAIADTDFATETSSMTRNQILVQSAQSVLAQANQSPQAVLKLLG